MDLVFDVPQLYRLVRFISHIEEFEAFPVAEVTIGDDAIPCALSSPAKPVSHPVDLTWKFVAGEWAGSFHLWPRS